MAMVNNTLQNEPSEIHGQDTEVRQVTNRLPIARQNLQAFNESTVSVHMWEVWTIFVLHVEHLCSRMKNTLES